MNAKEGKLKAKRRAILMDDVDLIGTEYIWRVRTYLYCLVQLIFLTFMHFVFSPISFTLCHV